MSPKFVRLLRSVARNDSAGTRANGRPEKAEEYAKVGKRTSEAVVASNSEPGAAATIFRGSLA